MSSDPRLTIRRATNNDWRHIWPIVSMVFAAGETYAMPANTPEDVARVYWAGEGVATYVAEQGESVVGTYAMRANQRGPGSHVVNAGYMVHESHSGRGIGATMCQHSLSEARAAGYRSMQFNAVVSVNLRAVALWQRLGFDIVGTVPQAFLHPTKGFVDLYIMHRFL